MYKMIVKTLLPLLCVTFSLSGALVDELEGMQQLDCALMPLLPSKLANSREKGMPTPKKSTSKGSSFIHIPLKEGTSLNWSGYVAATNLTNPKTSSVSNVYGSWTVPTLLSSPETSYVAVWTGIDGYTSPTVEQCGTQHVWQNGTQQNLAWFEMYPARAYEIVGFPVNPGDVVANEVFYVGNGVFRLTLINYTQQAYFIVPASYTKSIKAKRSSAEWIVEAPSSSKSVLPLADFSTALFTNCSTTINSVTGSINNTNWKYDAITMTSSSGTIKAIPSSLSSDGTSFSVTWKNK